jgi:hypothetical protein
LIVENPNKPELERQLAVGKTLARPWQGGPSGARCKRKARTTMQSLQHKVDLATAIRTSSCRDVFTATSRDANLAQGDALRLIAKEGKILVDHLLGDHFKENGDDAAVAPLLETEKGRILACYDALPVEKASLEISFETVTVVEPSSEATVTLDVEERIKLLLAFKETTTLSQLQDLSRGKWEARCLALSTVETDVDKATIGPPVDGGFTLKYKGKKKSATYQDCAQTSVEQELTRVRALSKPPTAKALKKLKRDAFREAYGKLVELVEAAEEKAIGAMPAAKPALAEALRKRFEPRVKAAEQRKNDSSVKGVTEKHRRAKDQGVDPLAAAKKELAKRTFGACLKPSGDERAPNNNYKPYVYKRIEHGIAKATKITSWMKYEEPEST